MPLPQWYGTNWLVKKHKACIKRTHMTATVLPTGMYPLLVCCGSSSELALTSLLGCMLPPKSGIIGAMVHLVMPSGS